MKGRTFPEQNTGLRVGGYIIKILLMWFLKLGTMEELALTMCWIGGRRKLESLGRLQKAGVLMLKLVIEKRKQNLLEGMMF